MVAPSPQYAAGEFDFNDSDFERVRKLIYSYAGISLSESKRQMVYSRLGRRLRALDLRRFEDYLVHLETGDASEKEAFVNALTTNLTSFFREPHHFPILAEHARRAGRRELVVWCSAASTGEEPYSIAITLMEALGPKAPVRILATDVDTSVLDKADQGVYPLERVEKMPAEQVRRFFLRGTGGRNGFVKVRPELRQMITFRQINLLEADWPVRGPIDVIFCRNVMIYFDKQTQHGILKRYAPLLQPDGLLFAGHSESLHHAADLFRLRGKTVYELAARTKHGHA